MLCFDNKIVAVALATIVAQFISWACSIIYIIRKYPEFSYSPVPSRPDSEYIRSIIRLGLPLGFNSSIYSVGHLVVQALINTQGTAFIAGCSVATKITGISHVTVTAIAAAGATFSGQNYGACNTERLKKGHLLIPAGSAAFTFIIDMLFLCFAGPFVRLFTSDIEVLDSALFYLKWQLPTFCMYTVFNGIINYAHGVGEIKYPTIVNVLTLWGIRIPVAYIICRFFVGKYVILAYPVSFAFGMISMLLYYQTAGWKRAISIKERS